MSGIHMKGQKLLYPVRVDCKLENCAHNVLRKLEKGGFLINLILMEMPVINTVI